MVLKTGEKANKHLPDSEYTLEPTEAQWEEMLSLLSLESKRYRSRCNRDMLKLYVEDIRKSGNRGHAGVFGRDITEYFINTAQGKYKCVRIREGRFSYHKMMVRAAS